MDYLITTRHCGVKYHRSRNDGKGLRLSAEDRKRTAGGICAGVTSAWIVGLLSGRSAATRYDEFESYFVQHLRMQGANIQDTLDGIEGTEMLMRKGIPQASSIASGRRNSMFDFLPREDSTWAAYLGIHGHALGCGHIAGERYYYILDANYGLFYYASYTDMQAALEHFRAKHYDQTKKDSWIYRYLLDDKFRYRIFVKNSYDALTKPKLNLTTLYPRRGSL